MRSYCWSVQWDLWDMCLDEKRLAMPMYRTPWDDILYQVDKAEEL